MSEKKQERNALRIKFDNATTEKQRDNIFQQIKALEEKYRIKRRISKLGAK